MMFCLVPRVVSTVHSKLLPPLLQCVSRGWSGNGPTAYHSCMSPFRLFARDVQLCWSRSEPPEVAVSDTHQLPTITVSAGHFSILSTIRPPVPSLTSQTSISPGIILDLNLPWISTTVIEQHGETRRYHDMFYSHSPHLGNYTCMSGKHSRLC